MTSFRLPAGLSAPTLAMLLVGSSLVAPDVAEAHDSVKLPTGDYIAPLAPKGAVQQLLNPGLQDHPDFVAGGALISRLSPDGKTLAVLCAGHNSLVKPDGT